MKPPMLITTTDSIQGMDIVEYFGLVSTNVVLGTNLLADIGASFSDIFGGTSNIYQNKLDAIYKAALDKLKDKAKNLTANGIIGIRIDFDEISGGGKSMFMISAFGTAVKLQPAHNASVLKENTPTTILPIDLDATVLKLKIAQKIKDKTYLSDEDWEFLVENPDPEYIPNIMDIYLEAFKESPYASSPQQKSLRHYIPQILKQVRGFDVADSLYSRIKENPIVISTLIKETNSFSPERTLELFSTANIHIAISTLLAKKGCFSDADIEPMIEIVEILNHLPDTGRIELVKGLLNRKERFVCENNHYNDAFHTFCETCDKNIKGLTALEINEISDFKLNVEALIKLLGD